MIKEKVEIIYESIVEEGIETYRQLYEKTKITDKTIVFWKKAIKLYEKFGFKNLGIRKKYYNNSTDAYIMTKSDF